MTTAETNITAGLPNALSESAEGRALGEALKRQDSIIHTNIVEAYTRSRTQHSQPLTYLNAEDPLQALYTSLSEAISLMSLTNNLISLHENEAHFSPEMCASDELAVTQEQFITLRESLTEGAKPLNNLYLAANSQFALYVMAVGKGFDRSMDTEAYGLNAIRKQLEASGISGFAEQLERLENFVTGGNDHEGAKMLSHDAALDEATRAFLVDISFPRLRILNARILEQIAAIKPPQIEHSADNAALTPWFMEQKPVVAETPVTKVRGVDVPTLYGNVAKPPANFWRSGRGEPA